jgi:transglutaminase/protease-like cytokinesis protein 3
LKKWLAFLLALSVTMSLAACVTDGNVNIDSGGEEGLSDSSETLPGEESSGEYGFTGDSSEPSESAGQGSGVNSRSSSSKAVAGNSSSGGLNTSTPQTNTSSAGGVSFPNETPGSPITRINSPQNLRNTLTANEKVYYDKMLDGLKSMPAYPGVEVYNGIPIDYDIELPKVQNAYFALKNDYPDMFWLGNKIGTSMSSTGSVMKIYALPDYTCSVAEKTGFAAQLQLVLNEASRTIVNNNMSLFQRELALHDWLANRVTYFQEAVQPGASYENYKNAYNVIGALVEGKAVCEGYSRAFQLLLYEIGIDSMLVTGKSRNNQGHMWNMVKLGSNWYHVDTTWDDSQDILTHFYFNLTDADIEADHKNIAPSGHPAANSLDENYARKVNGYIQTGADITEALTAGIQYAKERGLQRAEFSLAPDCDYGFSSGYDYETRIKEALKAVGIDGVYQYGQMSGTDKYLYVSW